MALPPGSALRLPVASAVRLTTRGQFKIDKSSLHSALEIDGPERILSLSSSQHDCQKTDRPPSCWPNPETQSARILRAALPKPATSYQATDSAARPQNYIRKSLALLNSAPCLYLKHSIQHDELCSAPTGQDKALWVNQFTALLVGNCKA